MNGFDNDFLDFLKAYYPTDYILANSEDVKPESRFVEDLAADSLDVIQIVLKLEEEFDIEIPDDAVEQISTVQDAVDQIKSKKNA